MLRVLKSGELAILQRLLAFDFAGKETLIVPSYADEIDEYGSLQFAVASPDGAVRKLPPEGHAPDVDGININVLLFERGGTLWEMQFYRDDGSAIVRRPAPDEYELFCTSRPAGQ